MKGAGLKSSGCGSRARERFAIPGRSGRVDHAGALLWDSGLFSRDAVTVPSLVPRAGARQRGVDHSRLCVILRWLRGVPQWRHEADTAAFRAAYPDLERARHSASHYTWSRPRHASAGHPPTSATARRRGRGSDLRQTWSRSSRHTRTSGQWMIGGDIVITENVSTASRLRREVQDPRRRGNEPLWAIVDRNSRLPAPFGSAWREPSYGQPGAVLLSPGDGFHPVECRRARCPAEGPGAEYADLQEFGGTITPKRAKNLGSLSPGT